MPHLLITGANGQVGSELRRLSSAFPGWQFTFASSAQLDIADATAVASIFSRNPFDYCINCAAYTAVDKAESAPECAWQVNATAVEYLARACAGNGTFLIHLSSDYVYHNSLNRPLKEEDPATPVGVYARSKFAGDLAALSLNKNTMVVRTSWVYAAQGNNFVRTMLKLGRERAVLRVVADQVGSPTYARDLAAVLCQAVSHLETGILSREALKGIFHYSNEGVASWYDFALAIFEMKGIRCRVEPIETAAYPTPAARPPYSLLNKSKIKSVMGISIPHWRESLRICLDQIDDK